MTTSSRDLVDRDDVRAGVDAALAEHLVRLRTELEPLGEGCGPLVDALAAMLAGGKRLRAAFCYWSWRAHEGRAPGAGATAAGTGVTRETVLRVGAALELFQAAALFHDDVMDESDLRRGRPAAHRAFAATHRDAGWSGPADRFGESAAILLGDLALIASERELGDAVAGLTTAVREPVRAVFDTMRTEVTAGQFLDVLVQAAPWGGDAAADEARAREVIRAKSARYSVEHPLVLGAALAGGSADDLARCRALGLPLGEAFQLRDDVLGVLGDPAATGKPAGDDLREGKRTVLVVRALRAASPDDARLVRAGLGRRDLSADDVDALRAAVVRSGAPGEVEDLIAALSEPALTGLAQAGLEPAATQVLVALGRAAVDRHA